MPKAALIFLKQNLSLSGKEMENEVFHQTPKWTLSTILSAINVLTYVYVQASIKERIMVLDIFYVINSGC